MTVNPDFWANTIQNGECLNWTAGKTSAGYGQWCKTGKVIYAHRHAFELANGKGSAFGKVVMHNCDNPSCVNPEHLSAGTQKENSIDKVNKGRGNYNFGSACHNAKLNDDLVKQIRKIYSEKLHSHRSLAKLFNVSHRTIGHILKRKIWKHI